MMNTALVTLSGTAPYGFLRRDPRQASGLIGRGVHRAEYKPESGSLLVQHDGTEVTRRELRRALASLPLTDLALPPHGAPDSRRGADDLVAKAVLALLNATLPPAPRAALQLVQSMRAGGLRQAR